MTPFRPLCARQPWRQGATNSVSSLYKNCSQDFDCSFRVHNQTSPFLDNVGVDGPKITYNNEELAPGIRWYVFEHRQNLDKALADLERAGVTIAGAKSHFCRAGNKIVWLYL